MSSVIVATRAVRSKRVQSEEEPMNASLMKTKDFQLDVVVQGFPGRSVCHGGLGWSTIALLRSPGRCTVIDTGGFGVRRHLIHRLSEHGVAPEAVTDVVLTHSHYDHAVNWVLFPNARVYIAQAELDWALTVPPGRTPVAELYAAELKKSPRLCALKGGDELFPGLTAHHSPGHTPHHLIYRLSAAEHDVIFTGDAVKNRAEMVSRTADATLDVPASKRTILEIWDMWRRRPGSLLVPGHDVPMVVEDGAPRYVGRREAAISAWFGDDLEQVTTFQLVQP